MAQAKWGALQELAVQHDFTRLRIEYQTRVPCTSHEAEGACERYLAVGD